MPDALVSVIVPVDGPEDRLGECLEALARQSYPRREVIVVCAGQTHGAVRVTEGLRVLNEDAGTGLARLVNRGMKAAHGEVRVLLMPHCVPADKDWLGKLIQPFEDPSVGAVVSRCVVPDKRGLPLAARLMHAVAGFETCGGRRRAVERDLLSHLCDALRADTPCEDGCLYDETLTSPAEAVDLSVRITSAGRRIVVSPDATVLYHDPRETRKIGTVLRKALDWGHVDAVLARSYGFDWLGSQVHAAALLSLALLPVGLVQLPIAVVLAGALFLWGWFLPLRLPLVRWEWPVALLNLALYIALARGVPEEWTRLVFDPHTWHPAMVRQWWVIAAVMGSYVLLLAGAGARCAVRSILDRAGPLQAAAVFVLAVIWHLGSGIGYLHGRLLGRATRAGRRRAARSPSRP
jgi:glycosyltransferase involved in cell wall biosynthesis